MSTFKRILGWSLVVITIIGILACLFGIVGSWLIKGQLTESILNLLSGVQVTLASVEDSMTAASTRLQTAITATNKIQETASQLSENGTENSPILDKITTIFSQELSPSIKKLQDLLLPIWERVLVINNAVETLNTLPGIELPTLSTQLQDLNDKIQEVNDTVEQLQTYITDFKSGIVQNILDPFLAKIETIGTFLANLEQELNTYLGQVNQLQVAVENLKARLPSIITNLTILVSVLLVWVMTAQGSLLLAAVLYLKTGKKLWEFLPGKPAPGETVLKPEG